MRLRAGATLACLALLLAGCAEATDQQRPRVSVEAGGERWRGIASGLGGPEDPDSSNVCDRGERRCIDEVVREMRRRFELLAARCDHRAAFAFMYLTVTEGVGETGARIFENPRYLNHLDAVFAQLYFDAFDAHARGERERVPVAWQIALDAAERRQVTGLGDMLLGMNAHISRDLPFALARIGLETAAGAPARRDYDRVNQLLADVQDPMLAAASDRLDPSIGKFEIAALGFSAGDIAELIATWRSEAYRNAEALIEAPPGARRALVAARIETNAESRARILQAATSYTLLGETSAARDRYCQARHGAGREP
ncbi:MAG TPA: DUF5995 family protein [Thermoleophilaceae bacterium]|nr:DUF5995 family protein [Thermoleophilaceae bacterium]